MMSLSLPFETHTTVPPSRGAGRVPRPCTLHTLKTANLAYQRPGAPSEGLHCLGTATPPMCCTPTRRHYQSYGDTRALAPSLARALDAVTECSQSTHPTHRWVRKPGSPLEEHFGQQAPAAQLTGTQAPAGELLGQRSPARSRAAFAPRPSGRSCWPLTGSAPARQISSVKQTQSTRCG